MFSKSIKAPSGNLIAAFAIMEGDEKQTTIPGFSFHTEPGHMIMATTEWFARLTRDEVVQMARFFAEAASRMED